jgi:hypothetical protein
MQKCTTCQYYDRKSAKAAAGNVAPSQQGQCRRTAPMLNPVNSKSYMIEGVWPTVHDDDWCGEWKLIARRADVRVSEVAPGTALGGLQPTVPQVARIGAEQVRNVGTVLSAPLRPFIAPAAVPAAGTTTAAPLAVAAVAAGARSGDD